MTILGYERRVLYDTFYRWWIGTGTITEVETQLGAKFPNLQTFFYQSGILDMRGNKESGVTFQDAWNLLLLHLVLLALQSPTRTSSRRR